MGIQANSNRVVRAAGDHHQGRVEAIAGFEASEGQGGQPKLKEQRTLDRLLVPDGLQKTRRLRQLQLLARIRAGRRRRRRPSVDDDERRRRFRRRQEDPDPFHIPAGRSQDHFGSW